MNEYHRRLGAPDYNRAVLEILPELSPEAQQELRTIANYLNASHRRHIKSQHIRAQAVGEQGAMELLFALVAKGAL